MGLVLAEWTCAVLHRTNLGRKGLFSTNASAKPIAEAAPDAN